MVINWHSDDWEILRFTRDSIPVYNRPLNTIPVSNVLAQKITRAIYNNFNGLETSILYAGTEGDTAHKYYVMLPKTAKITTAKTDELRAFTGGYIACATSYA